MLGTAVAGFVQNTWCGLSLNAGGNGIDNRLFSTSQIALTAIMVRQSELVEETRRQAHAKHDKSYASRKPPAEAQPALLPVSICVSDGSGCIITEVRPAQKACTCMGTARAVISGACSAHVHK